MKKYTEEEQSNALKVVVSSINNCEKMQPKFAEGSSQHTLLRNRIKALYIAKSLIWKDEFFAEFSKEELSKAQAPILSIRSKSEKGIEKFEEGHATYSRLNKIIKSMTLVNDLLVEEMR